MLVREVMTAPAAGIGPRTPVRDVARFLLEHGVSAAPVVGERGEILGVVSEADLVQREELGTLKRRAWWLAAIADFFKDPDDAARAYVRSHGQVAADVMTRGAYAVHPDSDVADAAALMDDKRIKRVYVTESGKLAGVLTRADLVRVLARRLDRSPRPHGDLEIRDELQRRIHEAAWAPSAWITVTVHHGVVDLGGAVESEAQRQALIVLARGVDGVRRVDDHLVRQRAPTLAPI